MKIETAVIRKTDCTVSLIPYLQLQDNSMKPVAFCIKGDYFSSKTAKNLYNRKKPSLPPKLPKKPYDKIMAEYQNGDIPCYIIDRGQDIEIIVE